jgi:hypothetical protein
MEMEFDMGNDAFKKDHSLSRGRVYIEPKPLMIVIFPSWLKHGVESADCEGRISIAFNISPMYVTTHTK